MELLNRYLQSVRPLLPREDREDILAELSEEIQSAMDERASALGRDLTEAEQNEILGQFGPPLVVGGRYRPSEGTLSFGREIIGREIFPFYVRTLKLQLGIASAVICVIYATMSIWHLVQFGQLLGALGLQVLIQGGVVTLIFGYLQSLVRRNPGKWDLTEAANRTASKDSPWTIRFEAIVQFVVSLALLPWLHSAFWISHVMGDAGFLTTAWHNAYWPVMGATAANAAFGLARAIRPALKRYESAVSITLLGVMLLTTIYLLASGPWIVVVSAAKQREIRLLNDLVIRNTLLGFAAAFVIALVWEVVKVRRGSRRASQ